MRKQSKKRAAAWLLALCMAVCMTGAAEEAQYVYSHISYSSGTLTPGKQLSASMTVRRTEGTEPLTFALLLYQNDRLIGAEVDCQEVGASDVPLRAAVTLPDSVENCYVNAILWDNLAGMHAICSAGLLPGGSTELKSLSVDGESILEDEENPGQGEAGQKVYTRTVSARQTAAPRIAAQAADNGTLVNTVISGFPGRAEITTTAADGRKGETHIVNFRTDRPLAGNIKMTDQLKGTSVDNKDGTYSKSAQYRQNLRPGICPYADRTEAAMVIANMPEECIGLDYIAPCIGWKNDGANDYSKVYTSSIIPDWTTFTLYRSATLKVFTRGNFPQLEADGYSKVNGKSISMSNSAADMGAMYQKHVDVDSDEGVQIQMPSAGGSAPCWWLVVLDYDGYSE